MEKEKVAPMPGYIKILAWLISLSAFAIGFWHTHLGLKEFKPLSWEYGSLVVSGLVLMVLIPLIYDCVQITVYGKINWKRILFFLAFAFILRPHYAIS